MSEFMKTVLKKSSVFFSPEKVNDTKIKRSAFFALRYLIFLFVLSPLFISWLGVILRPCGVVKLKYIWLFGAKS